MIKTVATLLLFLSITPVVYPQSKSPAWLNGTWEGTGYQMDDNSTWTMQLRGRSGKFMIDYPSLKCGGSWTPIRITPWKATFIEVLRFGQEQCSDKGQVVIERLPGRQIAYRYVRNGETKVSSSAVLNRISRATGVR